MTTLHTPYGAMQTRFAGLTEADYDVIEAQEPALRAVLYQTVATQAKPLDALVLNNWALVAAREAIREATVRPVRRSNIIIRALRKVGL